ncbi:MAG: hypothetical protein IPL61_32225 [Myxococcales bacterium]|nr:hypothetical protein [Myxococcales bacterium]
MNMNVMSFLVGKAVTRDLGEERSTQLGLVAGMMPGYQGVLLAAIMARQEKPATPAPAPTDPKGTESAFDDLLGNRPTAK